MKKHSTRALMGKYDNLLKDLNRQFQAVAMLRQTGEASGWFLLPSKLIRPLMMPGFKSQAKHVKKAKHWVVIGSQGRQSERNPWSKYMKTAKQAGARLQKILKVSDGHSCRGVCQSWKGTAIKADQ